MRGSLLAYFMNSLLVVSAVMSSSGGGEYRMRYPIRRTCRRKSTLMRERKNLFCKLGGYWICTPCKSSPQPKLCAKNRLMCPWDGVPERLLPLNPVSIPCRTRKVLTHDFCRLKMRLRLRLYCLPTSENRTGGRCFMERSTLFPSLWPGGDRRGAW